MWKDAMTQTTPRNQGADYVGVHILVQCHPSSNDAISTLPMCSESPRYQSWLHSNVECVELLKTALHNALLVLVSLKTGWAFVCKLIATKI